MIHVEGFRMDLGGRTVIPGLSFDVNRGETFGLLGSNGSGKTTTIRALLAIHRPTAGTLHVDGATFNPGTGTCIGYLPEERGLYRKETVIDVMVYFGRLKGLGRKTAKTWSLEYLERVGLQSQAGIRLDKLSGGQQQKVQLGVTIMNDPQLLILDEPTKGFDPVNRRLLTDIIETQKNSGATLVLVTHQMDEVERLCDRVLLLKDGQAEAYGTVDQVRTRYGRRTINLTFTGPLPTSPDYEIGYIRQGKAELHPADDVDEAALLTRLVGCGVAVTGFTSSQTPLEDIFLNIYGNNHEAEAA